MYKWLTGDPTVEIVKESELNGKLHIDVLIRSLGTSSGRRDTPKTYWMGDEVALLMYEDGTFGSLEREDDEDPAEEYPLLTWRPRMSYAEQRPELDWIDVINDSILADLLPMEEIEAERQAKYATYLKREELLDKARIAIKEARSAFEDKLHSGGSSLENTDWIPLLRAILDAERRVMALEAMTDDQVIAHEEGLVNET